MTTGPTTCDQCRGRLYPCDLAANLTTCVECARRAIRASRTGTRATVVTGEAEPDEWATFTAALRQAAAASAGKRRVETLIHDGEIETVKIGRRRLVPTRAPGLAASSMSNECSRCGGDIEDWRDAAPVKGKWVHKGCTSGASDE